jgi:glycerophosphoryl diester phosphodiesterase
MALWILPVTLLLFFAVLVYCIAPGKMPPEAKKMARAFYGRNLAHRGLHDESSLIENSLGAFAAAREAGYGVELDVHLSKDGQVVVFHDDDLKRACGLDRPIKELSREELSALSLFGSREGIPLLSEALDVLGDAPVIVEIKSAGKDNAKLCQKTLETLRAKGRYYCVESFDPRVGAWFRKNAPDLLRGQLSAPPRKLDTVSKTTAFFLGNLLVNCMSRPHYIAYNTDPQPFTVRLCRAMGPMTAIWTVRPDNEIERCEKENDVVIFEHYRPPPLFKRQDIE